MSPVNAHQPVHEVGSHHEAGALIVDRCAHVIVYISRIRLVCKWPDPDGRTGASHRRLIGSSGPAGATRHRRGIGCSPVSNGTSIVPAIATHCSLDTATKRPSLGTTCRRNKTPALPLDQQRESCPLSAHVARAIPYPKRSRTGFFEKAE
jgi:hypothetical protein